MIDMAVTRTYDIKLNPSKSQRLQLDSYFREAKWLYNYLHCDISNKLNLSDRIYKCSCGYTADRDIHAAQNMLYFAKLA